LSAAYPLSLHDALPIFIRGIDRRADRHENADAEYVVVLLWDELFAHDVELRQHEYEHQHAESRGYRDDSPFGSPTEGRWDSARQDRKSTRLNSSHRTIS